MLNVTGSSSQNVYNIKNTDDKKKTNQKEPQAQKSEPVSDTLKTKVDVKIPPKQSSNVDASINLFDDSTENHTEPYQDPLAIADYPLSHPSQIDSVVNKSLRDIKLPELKDLGMNVIESASLNPNTSDKTLGRIASFLVNQKNINEDLIFSVLGHKNISSETVKNISEALKNKPEAKDLRTFCEMKLKSIEK